MGSVDQLRWEGGEKKRTRSLGDSASTHEKWGVRSSPSLGDGVTRPFVGGCPQGLELRRERGCMDHTQRRCLAVGYGGRRYVCARLPECDLPVGLSLSRSLSRTAEASWPCDTVDPMQSRIRVHPCCPFAACARDTVIQSSAHRTRGTDVELRSRCLRCGSRYREDSEVECHHLCDGDLRARDALQ